LKCIETTDSGAHASFPYPLPDCSLKTSHEQKGKKSCFSKEKKKEKRKKKKEKKAGWCDSFSIQPQPLVGCIFQLAKLSQNVL
jgi:hypothetical protein